MDDYDYNSAMDIAIEVIKEQLQCSNNTCCAAQLHLAIKRLEKRKIKNEPAEPLMQDHYMIPKK